MKNRDKREHDDFSRARNNGHKILLLHVDLRDSKTVRYQYGHYLGGKTLRAVRKQVGI